ncbi:hypothetical protein F5878DRAFT_142467 [Lentinula raphanica]|uniref:Uncharacterized protein n=1 Tax=Lentinula raphanica TaxID=153919 RepID=A0AA38PAE3_9AGAR|nr:hypothetical protein F5878DRAFT_142467 [Lentinula raphanica]
MRIVTSNEPSLVVKCWLCFSGQTNRVLCRQEGLSLACHVCGCHGFRVRRLSQICGMLCALYGLVPRQRALAHTVSTRLTSLNVLVTSCWRLLEPIVLVWIEAWKPKEFVLMTKGFLSDTFCATSSTSLFLFSFILWFWCYLCNYSSCSLPYYISLSYIHHSTEIIYTLNSHSYHCCTSLRSITCLIIVLSNVH